MYKLIVGETSELNALEIEVADYYIENGWLHAMLPDKSWTHFHLNFRGVKAQYLGEKQK